MAVDLRLNRQQNKDLQAICRLDLPTMEQVLAAVEGLTTTPLHPDQIKKALGDFSGDKLEQIEALLRQTLSLATLQRFVGLTAGELLTILGNRIPQVGDGWEPDARERWHERQSLIVRLLDNPRLRTVAKALELSYDYMNLLQVARIVTDVRPIYDDTGARVEGLIVSFTLRLMFDGADGAHSLSIALDEKEVSMLEAQCQRALVKARTAVTAIAVPANLPVKITGAKNDADA